MRLAIAFVVLLVTSSALAAPPSTVDKEAARAAYDRGIRSYNLAEFGKALDSFRDAYRVYPDSSFLYNIAQCYRQLGDKPNAIQFYRTYLREVPDGSNGEEVRQLIANLQRQLAEEDAAKSRVRTDAVAQPQETPSLLVQASTAPTPKQAEKPVYKRPWVWIVVGGVVAAGVGVGLGVGLGRKTVDPNPSMGALVKN